MGAGDPKWNPPRSVAHRPETDVQTLKLVCVPQTREKGETREKVASSNLPSKFLVTPTMPCDLHHLYNAYHKQIRSYINARIQDANLSQDLVQEAFLKVTEFCHKGGACQYPKSFIYRVAQNVLNDHLKKGGAIRLTDAQDRPVEKTGVDFTSCLMKLMEKVPQPYREAVQLADLEQIPQKELAQKFNISLSGMKSRIQRGREKYKKVLEDTCEIEHDVFGNIISCHAK